MPFQWDADQYLKFAMQRTQPSRDLCNRLPADSGDVHRVLDIGCGPGNSTAQLRARYPHAQILGIDSSAEMIDSARGLHPDCDFAMLDASALDTLETDYDVVFSNACLQWVPDHMRVLPAMLRRLNPGGVAAAQFTENINLPPHVIMRETALEPRWRQWIGEVRRYHNLGGDHFDVRAYYDLLAPCAAHVDVWETNYCHALPGYEAILDWFRGSGLRPYLAQLPNDELRGEFEQEVLARIRGVYPVQADGMVLIGFPRFFFLAEV
jgi:trans-aconitate 2-methyltransferase